MWRPRWELGENTGSWTNIGSCLYKCAIFSLFCGMELTGCALRQTKSEVAQQLDILSPSVMTPNTSVEPVRQRGYSGMTLIAPDMYVVVHDTKNQEDGPHLGLLRLKKDQGVIYNEIVIQDWQHPDGRANDLESVCALPNHVGEFLAVESGYWEGRYGRIFHLRLQGEEAQVLGTISLPSFADNGKGKNGDNFEGVVCIPRGEGKWLVVLGERGGSEQYPTGVFDGVSSISYPVRSRCHSQEAREFWLLLRTHGLAQSLNEILRNSI
jgi:hypothetical protein